MPSQKFTFVKVGADFSTADEALEDIKSALVTEPWKVEDKDIQNVTRTLENSTTLIETRTWTDEAYINYCKVRGSYKENHRENQTSDLTNAGWTVKVEDNGEIVFNNL